MKVSSHYDSVGATVEILGDLELDSKIGTIYMNGVSSLASIKANTDSGDIKGSAVVSNYLTATSNSGNLNIIELFLGIASSAGSIRSRSPEEKEPCEWWYYFWRCPRVDEPKHASSLLISLQTGEAGSVKPIVNGMVFWENMIYPLYGKGVLIEGETLPDAVWEHGCAASCNGRYDTVPPKSCPKGENRISTVYITRDESKLVQMWRYLCSQRKRNHIKGKINELKNKFNNKRSVPPFIINFIRHERYIILK